MPRLNLQRWNAIDSLAGGQRGLVTAAQLVELGLSADAARRRAGIGHRLGRVLPGIYSVSPDLELTVDQRRLAAVLFARPDCALTGPGALDLHGVRAVSRLREGPVHVVIPHRRRRRGSGFAAIERTTVWEAPTTEDGVPVVSVERATVDAARHLSRQADVQAIVGELLSERRCSADALKSELWLGQRRNTKSVKDAIEMAIAGAASAPEMALMRRWKSSGLPEARWNVDLVTRDGAFLARPDVFVPNLGLVIEVDSREFHSAPDDWEHTMRRDARMTSLGLAVLHTTPRRIHHEWSGLHRDVTALIDVQERRYVGDGRVRIRGE